MWWWCWRWQAGWRAGWRAMAGGGGCEDEEDDYDGDGGDDDDDEEEGEDEDEVLLMVLDFGDFILLMLMQMLILMVMARRRTNKANMDWRNHYHQHHQQLADVAQNLHSPIVTTWFTCSHQEALIDSLLLRLHLLDLLDGWCSSIPLSSCSSVQAFRVEMFVLRPASTRPWLSYVVLAALECKCTTTALFAWRLWEIVEWEPHQCPQLWSVMVSPPRIASPLYPKSRYATGACPRSSLARDKCGVSTKSSAARGVRPTFQSAQI